MGEKAKKDIMEVVGKVRQFFEKDPLGKLLQEHGARVVALVKEGEPIHYA